jgi:transcriptional regulator with XRE-family HTH domain
MVRSTAQRIASAIRDEMAAKEVSQVALSDETGIPRVTLRRRLNGHSPFNVDELELVCAHLGLDPAELLASAAA